MKKMLEVLLAVGMVLVLGASVSFAAPYISGSLGAVWVTDSDVSEAEEGIAVDGEISFDTGVGIIAAVGNDFDNGFRAEAEFGYRKNDMDELDATVYIYGDAYSGSGSIDGDVTAIALMANAFYDFMPQGKVSPFIGAGLGFANVEGELEGSEEDDNVFAYQAVAGVAFSVTQQMKIDVQYRYFATEDADFDGTDFEYATNNAMVGLRYSF